MSTKDPYRDWTPEERTDAWRNGDRDGCNQYDEDRESGDRAYEEWQQGGSFQDPDPDNRFS